MVRSDATQIVNPDNFEPVGAPTLSGTVAEDETLSVSLGSIGDYDGLPDTGEFALQWQQSDADGWSNIAGAQSSSCTLGDDQVGKQVSVQVSYVDGQRNF